MTLKLAGTRAVFEKVYVVGSVASNHNASELIVLGEYLDILIYLRRGVFIWVIRYKIRLKSPFPG